ncbi:transposase [Anabaenopsis elenkinii CCIBt3563]|uniref:Transposase n=2 Tax=Anabaenopsis TaxID=110103 RepID=A0A7S6RDI8_9CYAN|nr:transposase [Anabaenopsis elenkinii CCIBt3563]
MPAKNHLSQEQRENLLKHLKEQDNPYVREKILILLLMNDGKTYQQISDFFIIAYTTNDNSAKIVIILDNASYHKRKDILARIEAEMPNIILEFLPPYSPDYNLIELVWHSAKEYIAHRLFESLEQLEELLNKLLNEGGLIIKWERKVKNKGNAVYSI